jgi:hypothetical protein
VAQEGFLYEENCAKALQKLNWVKKNYVPAGASSDRPDLDLLVDGTEYGCELKKSLASSGSLVIHFNGPGKGYSFGKTAGHKEKEFMRGLGESAKVLNAIKTKWRTDPFIQKVRDEKWIARVRKSGLALRERYNMDLKNMRDIFFPLPKNTISKYYNLKKTYYLNVATHGFYLLGTTDPARISSYADPKIPLWDNHHTAVLRVRVQSKGLTKAGAAEKQKGWPFPGAQGYQITMEIQFKSVKKTHYNIGPVVGKSASIDEKKIVLPS